ncbi:RNA 3'-terminal phosphate cyclase domain-containing protein [Rhexocercosporidium sp. MPI-PUGE-AT-0058]|nr:RNA 3'-terminal phosphate cyclase domain-containing protein [Rhexocercosporidium sp. MPI-PUGE-AT-0058]
MAKLKLVTLDGRTGEGGGQLVRVAVALAALTGTPIRINNVRGNRAGKARGGGLKAQHVSCIQCLADATQAEVKGCFVGSKTIDFKANISPDSIKSRNIRVKAESAASILLVFQATLPFFLFAGDEPGSPITLTIQGGSNVSFSLSFEYLDQVLLPALERFGIKVERTLEYRGWSHGTPEVGSAKFTIAPMPFGQPLKEPNWPSERGDITRIDVSILVPEYVQQPLKEALAFELAVVFPGNEINFLIVGDSRHRARMYTLLVAHTTTGLRFGRDWLYSGSTKNPDYSKIVTEIAQRVVDELDAELRKGGVVDEYLQDQLIVFQALAEGRSSIARTLEAVDSDRERVDCTDEPFGDGSLHTTTARWVASQLLPHVKWINDGRICEGAGWKTSPSDLLIEGPLEDLQLK